MCTCAAYNVGAVCRLKIKKIVVKRRLPIGCASRACYAVSLALYLSLSRSLSLSLSLSLARHRFALGISTPEIVPLRVETAAGGRTAVTMIVLQSDNETGSVYLNSSLSFNKESSSFESTFNPPPCRETFSYSLHARSREKLHGSHFIIVVCVCVCVCVSPHFD